MDQVVWVDDNDNILGNVSRIDAHQKGLWHRVSVIYLYNDQGEILVQHRADGRLDHSSAGHVDPGESYLQAAKRELEEELGVKNITLEEVGKDRSESVKRNGDINRHQYTIYKCKANPIELNKEEVKAVYWEKPENILKDIQKDPEHIKYTKGFNVTIKLYLKNL